MAKEKSLVEEAIIQMKNLEEAVAENAKGILASTMKEEINELVKESLTEQEEDEIETDIDMELPDMEDEESDDEEGDEMDMDNLDMDDDDSDDEDEDVIDLTNIKDDEEILRVFKLMGPDDNIVVTKDDSGNINIKDNETDAEYMVVTEGEGEYDEFEESEEFEKSKEFYESGESIEDIVERMFGNDDKEEKFSFDDEGEGFDDKGEDYEGFDDERFDESEIVYEIEMDEDEEGDYMGMMDEDNYMDGMMDEEEPVMESKMSVKPKGVGIGSPKFSYDAKPNQGKGFDVKKKEAPKSVGTGKPKFEYKEGENLDGEFKDIKKTSVKKVETKEAARTYGNGSKSGRGLRKGITPNRNLTFENTESSELTILREKNEEYRKALNVFRNKLNEVAVFNSNLAYATRLFTEHTTSKQEKINILRRFDSVETIKESKNLYQNLKEELSVKTSQPMNESMERVIQKTPLSGSAINLIESKTYENPQFLRMKDLMGKLK